MLHDGKHLKFNINVFFNRNLIIYFYKVNNLSEVLQLKEVKENQKELTKVKSSLIDSNLVTDSELLKILNKFIFYNFLVFILIIHILCLIVFPVFIEKPIEL